MKRTDITLAIATAIALIVVALWKDVAANGTTAPIWKMLPAVAILMVAGLSARLYTLAEKFKQGQKN
ncbi:hypothetical protein GCM10023093_03870 [Nemorincola caseinilytica]|uniref:Uncharacterized protein n=1 Tax=Nemorincola caseinilytica TaxID=2054315 RepID=A0ABP8N3L7_9BACT